jgi:hypothetical protein
MRRSNSIKKKKEEDIPKTNRMGLPPPKRIDVANSAVADELLTAQKLLYLQQDDYYKAQEHISLLSGEIDGLKDVVAKKQALINKLKQAIQDRDYTIEEEQKEVKTTHIERSAFKVLEDQNAALIRKIEDTAKIVERLEIELKAAKEEGSDIREYSTEKMKGAIEAEVKLQSKLQETGFALNKAIIEKNASADAKQDLVDKMTSLQAELLMVSETSREKVWRSRQTEYKTLRKYDEISGKYQQEKDEKESLLGTVKMANMRGDMLQNRLANILEKGEDHQLMVESIMRQVEDANDALRKREVALEKENMNVTAQLKVSQMAVADMLRRYKLLEGQLEDANKEMHEIKQANKPKRKDGGRGEPPGMGGSTTARINKLYMDKLADLTAQSVETVFPHDTEFRGTFAQSLQDVKDAANAVNMGGGVGGNFDYASTVATATMPALPRLLAVEEGESAGKKGLLSSYLRLLLSKSNAETSALVGGGGVGVGKDLLRRKPPPQAASSGQIGNLELARCELVDGDLKIILQWLRSVSLRTIDVIDLSYNKFTQGIVEMLAAFVIAIPGADLNRKEPLVISLRNNQLTPVAIETMGLVIRKTPRSEVKLVEFEDTNTVICLYGVNKCLVRIDCRGNDARMTQAKAKPSLKERLSLGSNLSEKMDFAFPGDAAPTGTVYPRNEIMKWPMV